MAEEMVHWLVRKRTASDGNKYQKMGFSLSSGLHFMCES